jgi:hypothetical protein
VSPPASWRKHVNWPFELRAKSENGKPKMGAKSTASHLLLRRAKDGPYGKSRAKGRVTRQIEE